MIASEALSLQKQIPIAERVKAVLRADATNPFNFVRWTNPDTNISDANYGVISNSQSGRVMQLSLSVTF
jgi:hypothetical protein